jgi:hypothetical protein
MNAKNLISTLLLLFVAATIVTVVLRETQVPGPAATAPAESATHEDRLVAYYFHGDTRCPTCRTIEAYAHEAIASTFAEELAAGKVAWQVVNYQSSANAHFATDYRIMAPTVVLVRSSAGQPDQWRNLSRVWEFVGEKPKFVDYVRQQAQEMLADVPG